MFLLVMFGVLGWETKTETGLTFNCSRFYGLPLDVSVSLLESLRLHFWSGILHRSCRLTLQSRPRCFSTWKKQTGKAEDELAELCFLFLTCFYAKTFAVQLKQISPLILISFDPFLSLVNRNGSIDLFRSVSIEASALQSEHGWKTRKWREFSIQHIEASKCVDIWLRQIAWVGASTMCRLSMQKT